MFGVSQFFIYKLPRQRRNGSDIPEKPQQGLRRRFEFYNRERLHQALKYRTPAEVYFV
jgi:transposase InsO family protein